MELALSEAVFEKLASVVARLAAHSVEWANFWWSARIVTKGASKVTDNFGSALMAVSGEVAGAIKWIVLIIRLKLKDVLNRLSIQIETGSQAAISCVRSELERNTIEALQNVATSQSVLQSCTAEIRRSLLDMTNYVAGSGTDIALAKFWQTENTRHVKRPNVALRPVVPKTSNDLWIVFT